jgi:hypothetical protein
MKHPILTKDEKDRRVSEMWDELVKLPQGSPERTEMTTQATEFVAAFNGQQAALQNLWNLCNEMCPGNPCKAANLILDNSQALRVLAQSKPETIGTL